MMQSIPSPGRLGLFALLGIGIAIGSGCSGVRDASRGTADAPCPGTAAASLVPAAAFFQTTVQGHAASVVGQPAEGFTPERLREAYPRLEAKDFHCVQANGGFYWVAADAIVFTPATGRAGQTGAAEAITPQGMGTLLENLGRRLGMPIGTETDVGAVIAAIAAPGTATNPRRTTLEGTYGCLPHLATDGPHTLECAFGLETAKGHHYALDLNLLSSATPPLTAGARIRANGIITPIEALSSDHWQKYDVQGIFSVTDGLERL